MVSVLVVEDEGLVGLNLQRQLKSAGYEVPVIAASADEALAGIKMHNPDVVLMDIHIQGPRDGIETAEEIRKTSQTPIIFITALTDKVTMERARKTAPSGYLVKPISFPCLTSSIEIALDQKRARQDKPSSLPAPILKADGFTPDDLQLIRTITEATRSPIALVDREGQIVFANSHLESFLAYGRNELTGLRIEALNIQNEKRARRVDGAAILAACLTRPPDLASGWCAARKDGKRAPVRVSLSPVTVHGERLVTVAMADLSKQKDAGEVSQLFESLVKSVKEYAIFMLDVDGTILTWNTGAERIKGYTAEQIIGKHFSRFYTSEDIAREHPQEELRLALAEGKFAEEGWRLRRDGSRFWASVIITPIYDKDGHHTGFSKVTHDITERREAENALRRSEQEFRLLADAIPHIVWIAEADGRSFYNNRRWYEFSGFNMPVERTDLPLRERWTTLVHPDEQNRAFELWMAAISEKAPFEGEYRLWDCQRQQYRWHLARALPVTNDSGEVGRWFGTLTDIHEGKTAAEELETEVRMRTVALSESVEQLRAKEETLQQSLAEKDVLLREIHHRVKNNLQIISSLLNMQANNLDDEAAAAQLRDSERRVVSMALIHEHLYGNDKMSSIDFADYVGKLVPMVVASIGEREQISYRLETEQTILTVEQAIPCSLILNELVTNALKYAHPVATKGEITVTLRSEGRFVTLRVADDGVGLPAAFDLMKTKTLGLQIINILTKQLSGTLDVDGSKGAAFTIQFPREQPG